MFVVVIVACEIGFWVVLASGLVARYVLRRPRLGGALLVGVALVDLVLLAATVVSLARGETAGFGHGLAAAYLGFSVAFGHGLIRRADAWFAHRYAEGPRPQRRPKHGSARTRYEWAEFRRAALAWAISCSLLVAAILVVGAPERTEALEGWIVRLTVVLAIWSLWPVTLTLWPARPKAAAGSG